MALRKVAPARRPLAAIDGLDGRHNELLTDLMQASDKLRSIQHFTDKLHKLTSTIGRAQWQLGRLLDQWADYQATGKLPCEDDPVALVERYRSRYGELTD
jgi:DNA repair ATPase RecN